MDHPQYERPLTALGIVEDGRCRSLSVSSSSTLDRAFARTTDPARVSCYPAVGCRFTRSGADRIPSRPPDCPVGGMRLSGMLAVARARTVGRGRPEQALSAHLADDLHMRPGLPLQGPPLRCPRDGPQQGPIDRRSREQRSLTSLETHYPAILEGDIHPASGHYQTVVGRPGSQGVLCHPLTV